jgi:hypothetical protein
LYDTGTPAARVLQADWDGVMPMTQPSPAAAHAWPAAASTQILPDPGLPDSLGPEFALSVGSSVRLRGQQLGVQVGGFAAVARRPAQLDAVRGLPFAEQQIIRFALDRLAGLEAERFGAGSPPATGWFSPALGGPDVVAGRVLRGTAVDLLPDVVKVIALAQRCDNRQLLIHRQRLRRDCPCSSHGAWV